MAVMGKRKPKPKSIHSMAYHRGLNIHKAVKGGWFITLSGPPWGQVLYATHQWEKIRVFIMKYPILLKRNGT